MIAATMPTKFKIAPMMTKIKIEMSDAAIQFKDFLIVKKLADKTAQTAAAAEKNKTQMINKIKPGSACLPE